MSPDIFKYYGVNAQGRDFCVGDIHGHYTRLRKALKDVEFNPNVDRLFSVGDLVDRGPESEDVLEWLDYPWFHPVRGNHDVIAIEYASGLNRDDKAEIKHGGAWLIGLPPSERIRYSDVLGTLPYFIEVETREGPVGIVHADVWGPSWAGMIYALGQAENYAARERITDVCLWSRRRIQFGDRAIVPDLRAVVVGHTPIHHAEILGNVYHIDTGGWKHDGSGHFTLLELGSLKLTPAIPGSLIWS